METVERFGVSMSPHLLEMFDKLITEKGYSSRSEALRDIVRNYIVECQWESSDTVVMGTLTLVYDHASHDMADTLTAMQHEHCSEIVCTTHVHIDEHNCLETIVMRGQSATIRSIADRLISTKGVKHGKLVCTTTGKELF
ncbi:MAG TPA: nickel-responsive transcriptional regulator NikR [Armatimonadota bacterium]|nr:nickel-responsive transcriptional regulator NikR [Armatimonadota bacterium]HPP74014.1 nickel-responsive transcriptional regulator NikR [Armatimonadota bacterium]